MKKAKVLLVEDKDAGSAIVDELKDDGFAVCWPRTPELLAQCMATETFDAAIADHLLTENPLDLKGGKRILGSMVRNGRDVRRLLLKFRADSPVVLYTTVRKARVPEAVYIQKPIKPAKGALKTTLSDFRENTLNYVRATGPWLMKYEDFNKLTFNEQIQLYKKALNLNAKWLKVALRDLGNVSWLLLGDKKVRLCGKSLNRDEEDYNPFNIDRAVYPDSKAITTVAKATRVFPYPFWNTSKLEYLDKQFALAGPGLSNYPEMVRHLFSIAVAKACADAYVKDSHSSALRWSPKLTPEGKVQLSKSVFKRLAGLGRAAFGRFVKISDKLTLPTMVEIYEAKVNKIDLNKSAAWIELRKFGHDRVSMVEPFNLPLLKKNGVKREYQKFEYAVYRWPTGRISVDIELTQEFDRPLFSFLD